MKGRPNLEALKEVLFTSEVSEDEIRNGRVGERQRLRTSIFH